MMEVSSPFHREDPMDIVALRSLHVLARTGSVAATAHELGFTPSAISQQIKRLERDVGATLLERVGRGVILTHHGEALTRHAPAVFAAIEQAQLATTDAATTPSGTVTVAAFATSIRGLIAPALPHLRTSSRALRLHIREMDPPECALHVARGHADVAIVHDWVGVPVFVSDDMTTQVLAHDIADVLVPTDHPLASRDGVTALDLLDEPLLSNAPGTLCAAMYAQVFAELATPPRPVGFVHEYSTQIELVAAGSCLAIVPRLGRGTLPDTVRSVPFTVGAPRRRISAAWRLSSDGSAPIRHVVDALADVVATGRTGLLNPTDSA